MNTAMESARNALQQKLTYLGSQAASVYDTSATMTGPGRIRPFVASSPSIPSAMLPRLSDRTVELLRSELRDALAILANTSLRRESAFSQYLGNLEGALRAFEHASSTNDDRSLKLAVALASAKSILQAGVSDLSSWLAISSAGSNHKQRYIPVPTRFISAPVSLASSCEADADDLILWSDSDDFTAP